MHAGGPLRLRAHEEEARSLSHHRVRVPLRRSSPRMTCTFLLTKRGILAPFTVVRPFVGAIERVPRRPAPSDRAVRFVLACSNLGSRVIPFLSRELPCAKPRVATIAGLALFVLRATNPDNAGRAPERPLLRERVGAVATEADLVALAGGALEANAAERVGEGHQDRGAVTPMTFDDGHGR